MGALKAIDKIALALAILGGITLGLVGAFSLDLLTLLPVMWERIVLDVIGLMALWVLGRWLAGKIKV